MPDARVCAPTDGFKEASGGLAVSENGDRPAEEPKRSGRVGCRVRDAGRLPGVARALIGLSGRLAGLLQERARASELLLADQRPAGDCKPQRVDGIKIDGLLGQRERALETPRSEQLVGIGDPLCRGVLAGVRSA